MDLISRQAAIDVASGYCHLANIADELRKLPAAQPEIVRCKDCKHNQLPATSANASCEIIYGMTNQNGFCSMAEPREVSE